LHMGSIWFTFQLGHLLLWPVFFVVLHSLFRLILVQLHDGLLQKPFQLINHHSSYFQHYILTLLHKIRSRSGHCF
jgi:hypothetical protein